MIKACKDHGVDVSIIDLIPVTFGPLEVSASTNHGIITLNLKLLCDGFKDDYSYIVHEGIHWLQQCFGSHPTKGSDEGEYLDNPYEIESFQNQIEYIDNNQGEEEAEDYVENLLDHHEVKNKTKRKEKEEELMAKV
jgi:hypothetical protein